MRPPDSSRAFSASVHEAGLPIRIAVATVDQDLIAMVKVGLHAVAANVDQFKVSGLAVQVLDQVARQFGNDLLAFAKPAATHARIRR